MTTNTPNRALEPGDLEWLESLRGLGGTMPAPGEVAIGQRASRILSHVSRLEGEIERRADDKIEDVKAKAVLRTALYERDGSLKLAVEALEPFAKDVLIGDLPPKTKIEAGGKVPRREEYFEIIGLRVGDFQRAREALRSIRSPIRGSDLESASQSASPPLRQDALPDLSEPYAPTLLAFDDPPRLEYIGADVPSISRRVDERMDLLLDTATMEPIGFRLYGHWQQALSGRTTEGRSGLKDDTPPPTNMDTSGQSGGEG